MAFDMEQKIDACLEFVLEGLENQRKEHDGTAIRTPLFVGINGVQGSGKTTLVSSLAHRLDEQLKHPASIVISIDDLYLTREQQTRLAQEHPDNPLIQHRGQPSTHDLLLGLSLFSDLREGKETRLPSYDKSAHEGQGDRVPEREWKVVNQSREQVAQIVILEGWCVGFRALTTDHLRSKWTAAVQQTHNNQYRGRLGWNRFEDIEFINEALKRYDRLTDFLDVLIHLDAEDPLFVYPWRLEQEEQLRQTRGSGMSNAAVKSFINGYYPAYELYTDPLRAGSLFGGQGRQLRLILSRHRELKEVVRV